MKHSLFLYNYDLYVFFHMNNCGPTFAHPCIMVHAATLENSLAIFEIVKYISIWPSNFTYKYTQEKWKHVFVKIDIQMFIAAKFIKAKKWKESKCISTDKWMKYGICMQWIFFNNKKEWSSDICYNIYQRSLENILLSETSQLLKTITI